MTKTDLELRLQLFIAARLINLYETTEDFDELSSTKWWEQLDALAKLVDQAEDGTLD